ncbi:MAG: membrane protein insertase YidC [Verrucomicrobia bacterium]|nr:membrane protein insertase YidC [Verrucomicrobiota bacterium]
MDRKSILILVLCFVLLLVWAPLTHKIYPPKQVQARTNLVSLSSPTSTNVPAEVPAAAPGVAAPPSSTPVMSAGGAGPQAWAEPEQAEELVTLDTDEARYLFTSHGGGLRAAELKGYPESVPCGRRRPADTNRFATLNHKAPLPALTLLSEAWNDGRPFTVARAGAAVRAEKTTTNGWRIAHEYLAGSNHVLTAVIRVENAAKEARAMPAQQLVIGTATPISVRDQGQMLGVQWYDGVAAEFIGASWFENLTLGCIPGTPRNEYQSPGMSNVVWAALHNQFFTMIATPQPPPAQLVARRVDLPPPTAEERAAERQAVLRPHGFETALVYPQRTISAGEVAEWRVELFVGPKEYRTLALLGGERDQAMTFPGFFGWFSRVLLVSMNGLHGMGLSYGLAIIAITVIIKGLFWPLTQASTRSMKRMQALQPQMKAIQEKYKADPRKMNQKLMEFMKENKVSPLGGCLPMIVQIPVFIGFYYMLQSAVELRGARFLWACDLSQPDTIFIIPGLGWIPFLGIPSLGFPVNPLPLLMGLSQFWQARMTPMSPGVDPVQQKIMQYMPLMFVFILYNFSSGLALYWTVQNLLSILQMKLTKSTMPPPAAAAGPVKAPVSPRKAR